MDSNTRKRLRHAELVKQHGAPEHQKDVLVDDILETFGDPAKWPMDDGARIVVLRRFFTAAQTIRDTERSA